MMAVSFLLVAGLGAAHAWLGRDVSLSVFGLAPVFLVSWFAGRSAGLMIAFPSALLWFVADSLTPSAGHPLVPVWNALVEFAFFVVGTVLVSALKQAFEQEKTLARTDPLTGVANSRSFFEIAERERQRARRYNHAMTIAYLDVDNFKAVNDRHGHFAGDSLLVDLVAVMQSVLRQTDVVARLGGDEFALLLPETGSAAAQVVSRKVQQQLDDFVKRESWPITFSIGVVTTLQPPDSFEVLLQRADDLMYEAKKSGKNQLRHEILDPSASEVKQPA
jgi:diguanylate cyclase (GGDEF)-like protein